MVVSLAKGQKVSLDKASGDRLTTIMMGLGWDAAKPKGFFSFLRGSSSIDLDASCLMLNSQKELVDSIWFRQLKSKDGSVVHSGDNLTGEGEGDDECIHVNLSRIPDVVDCLIFIVSSFRGQTFDEVDNAFCRLVDSSCQKEVARYPISGGGPHTAMVMTRVYRHQGGWELQALGIPANGSTFHDLLPLVKSAF